MKPKNMIFERMRLFCEGGIWVKKKESIEVTLMCSDGKWAMVRRKGCVPFVVEAKDLHDIGKTPIPNTNQT